jgi:catechol 2,3-dioxygenase-like lactoylglutathione lyase family enzyme
MSAAIDRLVRQYDAGAMSRRDFVAALAAVTGSAGLSPTNASASGPAVQAPKPTLPVRTLNHVTLFVSNVEQSVAFYQRLFGLGVMSKQDNGINLAAGESFVGIYPVGADAKPHINHFCLGVERFDADRTMTICAEHGVKSRIRMRGDVKELYLPDPDGISVQLQDVSYRG